MARKPTRKNFRATPLSLVGCAVVGLGGEPAPVGGRLFYSSLPYDLSPRDLVVVRQRRRKLASVHRLTRAGLSAAKAARIAGISYTTLWRWRRRIWPDTRRSGRRSAASQLRPSKRLLSVVRRRQAIGMGNSASWRSLASYSACPKALTAYLRSTRAVAPSLLALTRGRKPKGL